MSNYEQQARHHFDKIQYFYDYGEMKGYDQAEHHYNELSRLIQKVSVSKNNQSDAAIIVSLRKNATPLMEEMKQRRSSI